MIDELISYSYEAKRKFDIVAATGMALLGLEEILHKAVRPSFSKEKLNLGFTRNEFGQI